MGPILLVSARASGDLDEDMAPLVAALGAEGATPRVVCWDDPAVDWADSSIAVIRSTWDYTGRRDEFLDWARTVGSVTRLEHPAPVLDWNTDKRYLSDLAAAGVGIVPSTFFEPGTDVVLAGGGDQVVKPSISAGSRDTGRFGPGDSRAAHRLAGEIHGSGRTVLVQPYVPSVDDRGETALLYFAGEFSHAIGKGPLLAPGASPSRALFATETISARVPTTDELDAGDRVIRALATIDGIGPSVSPALYTRVDLVRAEDGRQLVLEVEMCEPSVFLEFAEGAATRFARAIVARANH